MDPTSFGSLIAGAGGGDGGGLAGMLAKAQAALRGTAMGPPAAAPPVPSDGAMQPTIGPGAGARPPAPVPPGAKFGLPSGGILGLLQGQSPQGLMGMLQRAQQPGGPLAGAMPQAGMLPGMPGSPMAGPLAPPQPPQLPTDINPMNQF